MSITNSNKVVSVAFTRLRVVLVGLVVLFATGCGSEGDSGTAVTLILPTDLLLNLRCPDVGINLETCVLEDRENPYRRVATGEFDVNNPDEPVGKLELLADIPGGPTGAKARFYLWATALARRPSGENQFFTAVALHELWTEQVLDGLGDPLIQEQAIKAYRSVLDNYFGSVTFFSTCDFLFPSPPEPEFVYSVSVSDSAGVNLVDPPGPTTFTDCDGNVNNVPGLLTLFPAPRPVESEFAARQLLGEWGFSYVEVNDDLVFVTVNN